MAGMMKFETYYSIINVKYKEDGLEGQRITGKTTSWGSLYTKMIGNE